MPAENVLECRDLRRRFGGLVAVDGVGFHIAAGEGGSAAVGTACVLRIIELLGAGRCRLSAHPGHGAPRPHRVRPSVRWMNSTSTDRGWKDRALPAASASIGDAPGAVKLIL